MRYYIIAGEASGDLHGSNLMRGLYGEDPGAVIRFWGGSLMDAVCREFQKEQPGLVRDYNEGAVIGFSQVILNARKFARRLKDCCDDILAWKPDAVILIDYPGFNFRVARFAHEHGLRVFYYIAPKVWASRESRIKKLKAWVDRLFIVFPFEKEYFAKKGVPYVYKGNPLIDAIDSSESMKQTRGDFFSACGLEDRPYVAILAGSRSGEVSYMMPKIAQFADLMHSRKEYSSWQFIIAGAPSRRESDYAQWLEGRESYMHLVFGQTYAVLRHAEAAVINSGTASLEAALIGTPQVVCYGGSTFNFNIARLILKVRFISLGNLILGRTCFRELLQYYFTPEETMNEVVRLTSDSDYRSRMLEGYRQIRESLGGSGASEAVARAMIEEITETNQ